MDKDTHPMVVLRTACSFLGALEPEDVPYNKENQLKVACRILGI